MASIKDKAVRNSAHAVGLVIPTSAEVECDYEWRLFAQWWNANQDVRNGFLSREVLFVEKDADVRRKADKCGISMRGRHSKNKFLRRAYLRLFGQWYFGKQRHNDLVADEVDDDTIQLYNPATLYSYDFSTGQKNTHPPEGLDRASPVKMPKFQNKSWRPSLSIKRVLIDRNTIEPPLDLVVKQLTDSSAIFECESVLEDILREESLPQKQCDVFDDVTPTKLVSDDDTLTNSRPDEGKTLSVHCKMKPNATKPQSQSFRCEHLGRLTSEITNFTSLLKMDDCRNLRGMALLRSKVNLVVMLWRILGPFQLEDVIEAVAPEHLDIFSHALRNGRVPAVQPLPPIQVDPKPVIVDKELLQRAKAHYNLSLRRRMFMEMVNWTRNKLAAKARKEREALEEKQKVLMMFEKATSAYNLSLMSRFLIALRDQAARQRKERATENTPLEPVAEPIPGEDEPEEFSFVARSPSVERQYFSLEDKRVRKSRKMFSNENDLPYLLTELDRLKLMIGRRHRSGLDVVCRDEYENFFAIGVELRRGINPQTFLEPTGTLNGTLNESSLQNMKREKLAGASNLFDVPCEFIYPTSCVSNIVSDVEYRTREKWKGLINQE